MEKFRPIPRVEVVKKDGEGQVAEVTVAEGMAEEISSAGYGVEPGVSSRFDSEHSVEKMSERGPARLRNAIAAGMLTVLAGCEKAPTDRLSEAYDSLNTHLTHAHDASDRFFERLFIDNENMVTILDTLEQGVQGDPLATIESDLRMLSLHGTTEFSFSIYEDHSSTWRLTALNEGDHDSVHLDVGAQRNAARHLGDRQISIHNHPLGTTFSEMFQSNAPEVNRQLELMRTGQIEPTPMPPSIGDLFGCAMMTENIAKMNKEYSCAVASGDGIWRVSIDPERAPAAAEAVSSMRDAYKADHRELFKAYTPEAIERLQNGDSEMYELERTAKEALVGKMISEVQDVGFEISFTPYSQ